MPDFLGGFYYPLASALTATFNVTIAVQHNVDSRHLGGIQVTEEQLSSVRGTLKFQYKFQYSNSVTHATLGDSCNSV